MIKNCHVNKNEIKVGQVSEANTLRHHMKLNLSPSEGEHGDSRRQTFEVNVRECTSIKRPFF